MRRFTRRNYVNDEAGYRNVLTQRIQARKDWEKFVKEWMPKALQKEAQNLVNQLIYCHQQTVSYQTEHEVPEHEIEVY
jgi:predicted thioredoxin/glutaredoxin